MKYLLTTLTIGIIFLVSFSSCGSSSNDCEDAALESTFSDATQIITNALTNFDPSDPSSCQDLKDAYDKYIDELEDFQDCANDAGQGTEWRQFISEARKEIGDLTC